MAVFTSSSPTTLTGWDVAGELTVSLSSLGSLGSSQTHTLLHRPLETLAHSPDSSHAGDTLT